MAVTKKKTAKKAAKKKVAKKTASAKKQTKKATASKKTAKKATATKKKTKKVTREKGPYDLVIVESPSKAKTIKKYLGKGYQVVASNGHIKDLPKSKLGVDIKDNFNIDLVPITGKKDKIERIQELAKGADNIFLAPDMDREGEAIAHHLAEEIGIRKKNIFRVVFNAVTKNAIIEAIGNPSKLNKEMYDSQKTRRVLDRLVGYKISPILWDKVQRGISAGRVQSVALRIIVEREDEINAFVPEKWFSIHGEMNKDKTPFEFKYYGEQANKKTELTEDDFVKGIVSDVKGKDFEVIDVKKRERKQNPTPPFTTSKLQQEAANKLGYTAKKTMMVAQKLYEGIQLRDHGMQGLITYMRTDSVRTAPEAMGELRDYIKGKYGDEYLSKEPIEYKKKGSNKVQDAHEAIRPTNLLYTPDEVRGDLEPDQQKLYELIWNKFISSQMSQAIIDQTAVTFECNGHFFKANGSIIKFPGFRTIYLEAAAEKRSKKGGDDEEEMDVKKGLLPEIAVGEKFKPTKDAQEIEHWTSPPPRYNEASIVKDLEEKGIGRPSTYASIISNIQDRGYVEKTENRFLPTELGIVVCRMLIESFPEVMNVDFTAKVEELLDKIEEGEVKWKKVLKDFWGGFEKTLERAKEEMKNLKAQLIPTGIDCQKCEDGEYHIKWGRNGQFFACSNYPDCNSTHDFKKNLDGTYTILPKNWFHEDCPTCHKRLEVKTGRYGRFVRCEEYPQCDTTLPYTIPVKCPKCKTGKFAEKKSRYGKFFYGCTSYPDCENALWSMPYEHPCKSCGYELMIVRETKRDGKHLQCPECKFKVDWEETPFYKKEQEEEAKRASEQAEQEAAQ
ncbi:MAG: type I DNA topoisomerase [Oligoflexia bacterium]|nr:type I DNA topoisomerase [Oligoflexia bacterium]